MKMQQQENKDRAENNSSCENDGLEVMSFGDHLEVMRGMLIRILVVAFVFAVAVFCFKEETFEFVLAPSESTFCSYRWIEGLMERLGFDFRFDPFSVNMIATDLSSQFMTHITTSVVLGLLCASPYILFELLRFVSPALYESERRYSAGAAAVIYLLFALGVLMTYFVLFPISFRFLGTYSVSEKVETNITLDSYISTFTTLTFVMGLVFQLPLIALALAKMGLVSSALLANYRKHALIGIMVVAAVITPPDLMTLVLVTVPLYGLYEISVCVVRLIEKKAK